MELTHDSFYRGESSQFNNWWKNWKWNCIFTSESSLICLLSPDRHWLLQLLHQCWMLFICTHHVCCILHVCWVIKHWDRLQTLKLSPTIRGCILRSDGLAYQCHYKSYSRFASLILTDLHSSKKKGAWDVIVCISKCYSFSLSWMFTLNLDKERSYLQLPPPGGRKDENQLSLMALGPVFWPETISTDVWGYKLCLFLYFTLHPTETGFVLVFCCLSWPGHSHKRESHAILSK